MIPPLVLAVDDSPTVRKIVEITLGKLGIEVITANDGLAGLTAINDYQPDLVLLDIMLPRMDGYAFCHAVRGNMAYRHLPIIMLSGKGHFVDRVKGKLAGATDYMTKPFDTKELVDAVVRYLRTPFARENAARREEMRRHMLVRR